MRARLLALLAAGCVAPPGPVPGPGEAPWTLWRGGEAVGGLLLGADGTETLRLRGPRGGVLEIVQRRRDDAVSAREVVDGRGWSGRWSAGRLTLQQGLAVDHLDLPLEADAVFSAGGGLVLPSAWGGVIPDLDPHVPVVRTLVDPLQGHAQAVTVEVRDAVVVDGLEIWRVYAWTAGDGRTAFVVPEAADGAAGLLGVDGVGRRGARAQVADVALPWPEPAPLPAGLVEEAVAITRPDTPLAGTLTHPAAGGPAPLVLLLPGSGPIDRDGRGPGFGWGGYRTLAHRLAAGGYAVLRVDKRGVGESRPGEGDGGDKGEDLDPTAPRLVEDASAWLEAAAGWPAVNAACSLIIGHSEGGSLAPLVARARPELDGLVLLGGPADDLDTVLREQLVPVLEAGGARPEEVRRARAAQEASLQALARGGPELPAALRGGGAAWIRSHADIHPARVLAGLDVPVLALYGGHDVQVLPVQAARMAAALADRPAAEVVLLPEVDHLLGRAPVPGMGHYADPDRGLDAELVGRIEGFLAARCPVR